MSQSLSKPLKLFAGTAAAALLIGWAAGVGAQTIPESLPQEQASLPASGTAPNMLPSLPLGHDDVREVQNQLIALGFDPGPADGQAGPATIAAAQQYDQNRGGSGQVSIDGALLARLKADTGPRLTYEQVAARSQARQQAHTSSSASGASQFGGIVQQIMPLVGAAIANSNNGYGPGYYGPGPGYYGPGPGYYGPGYGY
jgi:Putative peptidoglycan binding domain